MRNNGLIYICVITLVIGVLFVLCGDLLNVRTEVTEPLSNDRVGRFEVKGKGFVKNRSEITDIVLEYDVENGVANGYLTIAGHEYSVKGLRTNRNLILSVGEWAVLSLEEKAHYAHKKYKFEYEGSFNMPSGQEISVILSETSQTIEGFYAENGIKAQPSKEANDVGAILCNNTIADTGDNNNERTKNTNDHLLENAGNAVKPVEAKWGNCKLNGKLNQRTNVYIEFTNGYDGYLSYGGAETRFSVSGVLSGNNLRLTESHADSITGVYNGIYDGYKYVGQYKRKDGKTFKFALDVR